MKRIKIWACIVCLCLPLCKVVAQQSLSDVLVNDLSRAQVNHFSSYMASNLEVSIVGQSGVYTREQTSRMLSAFYAQKEVAAAKLMHQGTRGSSTFFIINLTMRDGGVYRVYLLTREVKEETRIYQFRIDRSNG